MPFDPRAVSSFRFVSWSWDAPTLTAHFTYAFDTGPAFVESLTFTGARHPTSPAGLEALDRCLSHLHLMLGISYYKAAVPPRIAIECGSITEEAAAFFDEVYLQGLGEFAYRNRLDLGGRIRFPFGRGLAPAPVSLPLERRTAVPIGGGKDSVVTLEALRAAGEPIVLFTLGTAAAIDAVCEASGVARIKVTRRLSPRLFEINGEGAYNGHVPISAVIAFVLAASSVLYGFDAAALSNERSANVGNLVVDGVEVNHQYSKGLAFERRVSRHFSGELLPGFRYFSFLRPLSELHIARLFSRSSAYHRLFTSCNAAFKLDESRRVARWCGQCPKCRSTFLLLAPFVPRADLIEMFGANLLDDPAQLPGFDELTGVAGVKPFECVGEAEEYQAAMVLLLRSEWRDALAARRFAGSAIAARLADPDALVSRVLAFSDDHLLPPRFEARLRAYSGSPG